MLVYLPELGEGVDSVDVVEVLVSVGESIEEEQGLIEVETEKASVEVPATAAGTVTEVHVSVGDVLSANAPIVTIEAAEGKANAASGDVVPEPEPEPVPESVPEPESAPAPAPENVEEKTGGREANSKF